MFRIYVGNLPYSVDNDELKKIFSEAGTVTDTAIPLRFDGKPKGFAFVEFDSKEAMDKAIETFNEKEVGGRVLRVSEAHPRDDKGGDAGDKPADKPMKEDKAEEVTEEEPMKDESPAEDMPAEDTKEDEVTDEATEETPAEEETPAADATDDADDTETNA